MSSTSRDIVEIGKALGNINIGAQGGSFSVAIPIASFSKTLTTLLYATDWFKAQKNNDTLECSLVAVEAVTKASSSFNNTRYEDLKNLCHLQVATLQRDEEDQASSEGTMQIRRKLQSKEIQVSLSHAGTEADRCRRAVTMALLCLFPVKETCIIMTEIIPSCLCENGQEIFRRLQALDPWPTLVLHYVKSVNEEESFTGLRERILQILDQGIFGLTNATSADLRNCLLFDLKQATVFVRWLLSSDRHSVDYLRSNSNIREYAYPTRSLQVWALAFILNEMGFTVKCLDTPVSTVKDYDETVENIQEDFEPQASIFLVTKALPGRSEDAALNPKGTTIQLKVKRRIQIRQIPQLVFEHQNMFLPRLGDKLTTAECSNIFLETFHHIKAQLPYYARNIEGLCSEDTLSSGNQDDDKKLSVYQDTRLRDWLQGDHAAAILNGPITRFLAEKCPDNCQTDQCCKEPPRLDISEMTQEAWSWKADVRARHRDETPWITMHLVMLGFVYAVASQFVCVGEQAAADEDTEVVLTPIDFYETSNSPEACRLLIPDSRLFSWVQTMAEAIGFHQGSARQPDKRSFLNRFRATLYDIICGVSVKTPEASDIPEGPPLGCCANGVTLVSLTLTRPKLQHANLYQHDLRTGRCLDLYVGDNRLICGTPAASMINRKLQKSIRPTRIPSITLDNVGSWRVPDVRWDPESNWEDNYQHTVLRCRLSGLPRFNKSPFLMIARIVKDPLLEKVSPCNCPPHLSQTFEFPGSEIWSKLDLAEFYSQGGTKHDVHQESKAPPGCKWYIVARAGLRTEDQVAALDCFSCRVKGPRGKDGASIIRKILGSCASCAFQKARSTPDDVNSILRTRCPVSTHIVFIVLAC